MKRIIKSNASRDLNELQEIKSKIEKLYGPIKEGEFQKAVTMLETQTGFIVKLYNGELLESMLRMLIRFIGRIRLENMV